MAEPRHSKAEVEAVFLAEAGVVIRECVEAGVRDYRREYSPTVRLLHSGRSRCSIIHDHVKAHLRTRLDEIPGAREACMRGLSVLVVDDQFVVKVPKRLRGKRLLTRTYPTEQTLAFLNHDPQGRFAFLADRTSLAIGYVLNELGTDLSEVHVTCPNGTRRNWWSFKLPPADSTVVDTTIVPPLSLPPTGGAPFTVPGDEGDEKDEPGATE